MRIRGALAPLLCALTVGTGCGSADGPGGMLRAAPGALAFGLDLAPLQAATAATITSATATISRTGHADLVKPLTVVNGIASGQVDGLEPGSWHVAVDVYGGATQLYTGGTDVNVIAGVTVQCQILFEPVVIAPTTGSIGITVGLNPMPGYTPINQAPSQILFDRAHAKLYVVDGTSSAVGVYDADTLSRSQDLSMPSPPTHAALNREGTGIFLGYASGRIHLLDLATGTTTLVADALMQVGAMVALDGNYLLVTGAGSSYSDTTLKVIDVVSKQIVSTRAPWYSLTSLLYNPVAKTAYAHHVGVSPTDIHYVKIDPATGAMTADGDSVYHGDYSFGPPLRLINGGTRIATASGAMFTSAELVGSDLRYTGSLGTGYVDLSADDTLGKLYLLYGGALPKLMVIDQGTYFVDRTVDLFGTPAAVFDTSTSVVVFATKDAKTYAKAFTKASLGL